MKSYRHILTRLLPLALMAGITATPPLLGQVEKTLRFIPEEIDFGVIREEDGHATRTVMAVNISPDTTFVISSRTSCGCSSAEFTEERLAPGDTTEITVGYNPVNRPGKFQKTAKIYTGTERISNSFKLKGMVIPSQKNLAKTYPDAEGPLRFSSKIIDVNEIAPATVRPIFIGIYNDSPDTLRMVPATSHPALEGAFTPEILEPHGVSTLSFTLRARDLPESTTEFNLRAYIINSESADTIATIPVGGAVKR